MFILTILSELGTPFASRVAGISFGARKISLIVLMGRSGFEQT